MCGQYFSSGKVTPFTCSPAQSKQSSQHLPCCCIFFCVRSVCCRCILNNFLCFVNFPLLFACIFFYLFIFLCFGSNYSVIIKLSSLFNPTLWKVTRHNSQSQANKYFKKWRVIHQIYYITITAVSFEWKQYDNSFSIG